MCRISLLCYFAIFIWVSNPLHLTQCTCFAYYIDILIVIVHFSLKSIIYDNIIMRPYLFWCAVVTAALNSILNVSIRCPCPVHYACYYDVITNMIVCGRSDIMKGHGAIFTPQGNPHSRLLQQRRSKPWRNRKLELLRLKESLSLKLALAQTQKILIFSLNSYTNLTSNLAYVNQNIFQVRFIGYLCNC